MKEAATVFVPNNLGPDFKTRLGCTCKKKFKYTTEETGKSKEATNQCIKGELAQAWCKTEGQCGRPYSHAGKELYWDYCLKDKASGLLEGDKRYSRRYFINNSIGIIVFILIFVIAVPIILYKNKFKYSNVH